MASATSGVRIPVFGNGDIRDGETAGRRIRESGVAGVVIGRGAMGNPWIFREICQINRGETPRPVSIEERFDMIETHYDRMLAWKPEPIAVREMRKHIGWYLHGLRGASRARAEINLAPTRGEVREILLRLKEDILKEDVG